MSIQLYGLSESAPVCRTPLYPVTEEICLIKEQLVAGKLNYEFLTYIYSNLTYINIYIYIYFSFTLVLDRVFGSIGRVIAGCKLKV